MASIEHGQSNASRSDLIKKLEAFGWALFLIWMGIAFLANVGWPMGILGMGVIFVAMQLARKYFDLPVESFGMGIGIVFIGWGVWKMLDLQFGTGQLSGSLIPILCIVAGVVIAGSALRRH
jgi:hypothetical protein